MVLPDATMVRTWACSAGLMLVNFVPVLVVNGTCSAVFSSSWNCPPVLAQVSAFSPEPPLPESPPTPQPESTRAPTTIVVRNRYVFICIAFSRSGSSSVSRTVNRGRQSVRWTVRVLDPGAVSPLRCRAG